MKRFERFSSDFEAIPPSPASANELNSVSEPRQGPKCLFPHSWSYYRSFSPG